MLSFEPKDLTVPEVHRLLLGGVAPRPIALVSTISVNGVPNLTPFSFFNAFGANPPVVAFSAARRGRDGTLKDTYINLTATKECVINAVTFPMVEQISLASTEYPPDVNEFEKSGLTPIDSDIVAPKRVKESPFQMECKMLDMISFGEKGASANLAVCEVLKFHAAADIFKNGIIQPDLIDLVARMSGDYYTRASGSSIFEVEKPLLKKGIGYDMIPEFIKNSHTYSANNLGRFGNSEIIPADEDVKKFIAEREEEKLEEFELSEEAFFRYQRHNEYKKMYKAALQLDLDDSRRRLLIELSAKCALEMNDIDFAWRGALSVSFIK
jgi:flavin reductase (DIM6/NTAB) family NADH-FMN oxidoreductase RutF